MRHIVLPETLFRFTGADRNALYTALLYAFGDANDRLVTSLTADDVRRHLDDVGWRDELGDAELTAALDQLVAWDLLESGQNHTERYRTVREYERRNLQFSLTRHGEAALAGHAAAVAALQATGSLQTAVLEAIADRLDQLADLAASAPPARTSATDEAALDRKVYVALQELEGHLTALAANVKRFNADLQRLLRAQEVDEETFADVKQATVTYLQEYLSRLDERAARIVRSLDRVRAQGVDAVLARALAGAELPPQLRTADREERWLAQARARWAGLDAWFSPLDGSRPRAEELGAAGRRAILALLQVLERLWAARRRPSSIEADFRTLARWFAAAPSDADLHRLWRVGFGLHSARHAHLDRVDPETVSAGVPWQAAPPVPVSRTLRESGRTAVFSRTGKVRDVSALRRERAEQARAEREQAIAALDALGTGGETRLSQIARLDPVAFRHLLALVGKAVAVAGPGPRSVRSSDGLVALTLTPAPGGARAVLRTTFGELECPDFTIRLDVVTSTRAQPATVGAVS
ncbi:TIGR02677 family protein [Promicromonospora umidemergens]|uniref:TIGR02677 family protein n=1 Tax=Promicromonospora umidemergens TaxID=629679 RepID=A0ABP8WFF5_9MICO|nr:TIGR02677 family protein [Promicromonospora umidemergens]MCP2284087.1 TIGR02677 family protein [Promicromonospora umidemergens]